MALVKIDDKNVFNLHFAKLLAMQRKRYESCSYRDYVVPEYKLLNLLLGNYDESTEIKRKMYTYVLVYRKN